MVNRPSQPEIITVNSEELQTQIRDLLPSQNGFGSELQASNVITPIIDLTRAAEGSGLPLELQTALAFGSQTAFDVSNTTAGLATSPGFYRIVGTSVISAAVNVSSIELSNGLSTKAVWSHISPNPSGIFTAEIDLIVWLAAGESVQITVGSTSGRVSGSIRQVADSTGTLVNPSGYPL
jgi:hypothetical protein